VATSASGSSRPGAESDLFLSLLLLMTGVRGNSHGVYVHHDGEDGTPRMTKRAPFLACQLSKWFHDTSSGTASRASCCGSFVGEGSSRSNVSIGGTRWKQKIYVVRAA
jgi:hypothetical protein